jgi:hypothetical protein
MVPLAVVKYLPLLAREQEAHDTELTHIVRRPRELPEAERFPFEAPIIEKVAWRYLCPVPRNVTMAHAVIPSPRNITISSQERRTFARA